jgi:hypothetical protein
MKLSEESHLPEVLPNLPWLLPYITYTFLVDSSTYLGYIFMGNNIHFPDFEGYRRPDFRFKKIHARTPKISTHSCTHIPP